MITLGRRGDLHRRSTSLACCRLCDRLLNLQRLRLLKRFCSLGIWRLRFRVRPAPARQPLRLRRCGRSKLFPGKMSWSWRRHPVLLTSYACGLRPMRRRFNNLINPELQDAARGGVLRIDEASFLSARAGRWLLEFARDSGTRLVVPDDVRQHHSVERGDWLRVMEQTGAICYAAITKIFRQQIAPLRDAVRDLSQGKIEEGLGKLEKFGAICQVEDKTERLAKIAELHLAALKERKSSLIVAPTHGECRTICGAVREAMKGEGMLSGPEQTVTRLNRLNLTEAQRGDAVSDEPGYVVEFHRNCKSQGWR